MRLTILGNNGPFQAAGGACSGYLIGDGTTNILLDCGNGVLSNLQKYIKFEDLDAVILTHLHSDHMADMMVLRYAVQIKRARGLMDKAISVFAPNEPIEEYNKLNIPNVFVLSPITPDSTLKFGALNVNFAEMKHPVKNFAVSVDNGKKRFVYSGDTSWNKNIIDFSKGADLLMLDSGLLSRDKTNENVAHLTAEECGTVAKEAGAKRLMLTHFWPEYDVSECVREAKMNFPEVEASRLFGMYEI